MVTTTFWRGLAGIDIPDFRKKRNLANAIWIIDHAREGNEHHPGINCLINQAREELREVNRNEIRYWGKP